MKMTILTLTTLTTFLRKQAQQVIDTLRQQGGYATWGNLYQIMDFSIKKVA